MIMEIHLGLKRKLSILRRKLIFLFLQTFEKYLPIQERKFFCISMHGKSYGCNIKPLSDLISNVNKSNKVVWAFSPVVYKKFAKKHSGKSVKLHSFSYYYELFTSKYILSNTRLTVDFFPVKREGQVYLQTWHGTALKRIEADMSNANTYYKIVKPDSEKIDLFIAGSKFMRQIYEKSFWYGGKVYETGTPRNDIFFGKHPDVIKKVKSMLGISDNEKIILYAPTFRTNIDSFSCYDLDSIQFVQQVQKKWGGQWKFAIRLHPNLLTNENIRRMNALYPGAINASAYPDMQELLYATDILITDYSSSMFDFMYTMRPCFLYVKDKNEYDRGFYMDISDLPFPSIKENSEIAECVSNVNTQQYKEGVRDFLTQIGSVEDGNATRNCYELLMNR